MSASASRIALCLALVCAAWAPRPAAAYTPAGVVAVGPGSVSIYIPPSSFPCTLTMTVQVASSGAAAVSGVSFGPPGSPICPLVTANNFPWAISAATLVSPSVYTFRISGFDISVRQASGTLVARCTGVVTATLNQGVSPHRISLAGTLTTVAPVAGMQCVVSQLVGSYLPTILTAP